MKEQLISFETAKLAKEKGCYIINIISSNGAFSENTVQFYNDSGYLCTERDYNEDCCVPDKDPENDYSEIPAPTQSLLQKWLREKHNIHIEIYNTTNTFGIRIIHLKSYKTLLEAINGNFNSYEEALEAGLFEALKLI